MTVLSPSARGRSDVFVRDESQRFSKGTFESPSKVIHYYDARRQAIFQYRPNFTVFRSGIRNFHIHYAKVLSQSYKMRHLYSNFSRASAALCAFRISVIKAHTVPKVIKSNVNMTRMHRINISNHHLRT